MPFNQFGEIIPENPGGNNRNSNHQRPPENKFNGWWIVVILILLFVLYEVFQQNGKSNVSQTPAVTVDNGSQVTPSQPLDTMKKYVDTVSKIDTIIKPADTVQQIANNGINSSPQNSNPLGAGNGKMSFYKTCNTCPDLTITVDGEYLGTLTHVFDESNLPSCDDYGTISKILSSGYHNLIGKDSYGETWNGQIYIKEGECSTHKLQKSNDVNANPYGAGNGQVTIYHNCSNCNNVQVSVDGDLIGSLTKYYQNGGPTCGIQSYGGTVIKNLSAGSHAVTGKDDNGDTWSGNVYISEFSCQTYALQNFTAGNLYGYGKGKVSFWTDKNVIYDVYIDGYLQGSIRYHFSSSEPTCGQSGTLSFILSEGSHSFIAKESGGGWKGTFYVTAGQCANVKVNKY